MNNKIQNLNKLMRNPLHIHVEEKLPSKIQIFFRSLVSNKVFRVVILSLLMTLLILFRRNVLTFFGESSQDSIVLIALVWLTAILYLIPSSFWLEEYYLFEKDRYTFFNRSSLIKIPEKSIRKGDIQDEQAQHFYIEVKFKREFSFTPNIIIDELKFFPHFKFKKCFVYPEHIDKRGFKLNVFYVHPNPNVYEGKVSVETFSYTATIDSKFNSGENINT